MGIPAACCKSVSCTQPWYACLDLAQHATYLELSQGETTSSSESSVVSERRGADDGSKLVDRSGRKGGGLRATDRATTDLLSSLFPFPKSDHEPPARSAFRCVTRSERGVSYLVEVASDPTLPILAEVCTCVSMVVVFECILGRLYVGEIGISQDLRFFWIWLLCLIAWQEIDQ